MIAGSPEHLEVAAEFGVAQLEEMSRVEDAELHMELERYGRISWSSLSPGDGEMLLGTCTKSAGPSVGSMWCGY